MVDDHLAPLWAPHAHRRLVEPFCGGLAVTLAFNPRKAWANDLNPHLINFYRQVADGLSITLPMENDAALYYEHRQSFNDCLVGRARHTPEAAALFYYLNRTGYNGLCRFSKKSGYNVPFGRYKTITYRRDFSEYVPSFRRWTFTTLSFEHMELRPDDFVFADPPYDDGFTTYQSGGFGWDQQVAVAEWLARHLGPVVATNKATARIVRLYTSLGFAVSLIDAPRRVSCNGDRKPVQEILATRNV